MVFQDKLKIGFVLTETIDDRFKPWEEFLEWESFIDLYAYELLRRGHRCVKYVPSVGVERTITYQHKFGYPIKRVPVFNPFLPKKLMRVGAPYELGYRPILHRLQSFGFSAALLHEIRRDRIDALQYSNYFSTFFLPAALIGLGIPTTVQFSGGDLPANPFGKAVWSATLRTALARCCAVLIGDYRHELHVLHEELRVPEEKIVPFEVPRVDQTIFHPIPRDQAFARTGFDRHSFNILVVSFVPRPHTIAIAKSPHDAIKVFAELEHMVKRPVALHHVGFGPGLDSLRAKARDLGVENEVMVHGYVPHTELPWYYSSSDLFFMPTSMDDFKQGTVVAESMSCGLPVVAFKRNPAAMEEQEGGFLIDTRPEIAAAAIAARLADGGYLSRKSDEALLFAKRFALDDAGAILESLYARIIHGS